MGRKRAATATTETSSPSKKIQTNKTNFQYRWEFEGDKKTWTQYSAALNKILTEAFDNDKMMVDFVLSNGIKICVNFSDMSQKNKKTGWQRPVRLAFRDEMDSLYYVWTWEDEKGNHNSYTAKITLKLETAYKQMDSTLDIEAGHRSYTVDIQKMEQTNTASDVTRKVFREQSAAVKPDPEALDPVASTSSSDTSTDVTEKKSMDKVKAESSDIAESDAKDVKVIKRSSARGSSGVKNKSGPADDDTIDNTKVAKSGGRTKSGPKERPAVKTMVMSGKAPVDSECTALLGKAHVYYEGSEIYDCMLNQTNVANNNNKYFIIQLLEEDAKKSYYVWLRWGRVGYTGQSNLIPCGNDLDKAKKQFMKKFSDKTKNDWLNRKKFVKVPGKYDLLEMDYSTKGADEIDAPALSKKSSNAKIPESKLDEKLKSLIELICDVKSMEEAVIEMQYDAKKAPLGKLTKDQIKAGYAALKKIDACIEKKDLGSALTQACDEFYTRIPHDFGMRPPSKIMTKTEVKNKIALLEALGDIEIAIKMLKEGDYSENPVDRHYHALKCDLEPLNHSGEEFKMIEMYLQNTHAATHNQYKMKLLDVFNVLKHGEKENFNDVGNRMLLWHGSRLTNWVGILSQGMRIAPPEAPVTGYMFGKGVYFADMSSKSANYCFATKTKNVGLMLLCDVALGNTNDLLSADYGADKLPNGKQSVKGAGKIAPDPLHVTTTPDGALVPYGKSKDTGVNNTKGYTLNYNEFIVYDTRQIRMKYLVQVQFGFK